MQTNVTQAAVMPRPEKYLPPKEIARVLCEEYGLCMSADYIRCIRRASRDDDMWVAGNARPSAVFEWIRTHKDFKRSAA